MRLKEKHNPKSQALHHK